MNINLQPLLTKEEAMECAAFMLTIEPWINMNTSYDACLKLFLNRSHDIFFVRDNGQIVAFCVIETGSFSNSINRITGLHADYRDSGIEQDLLKQVDKMLTLKTSGKAIYASADKNKMDIDFIYNNLKELYWATNLTRENLIGRIMNSMCFGVFINDKQKGFARVVTDYFSFAYLADVFVEESERGKGYSRVLMDYILDYPSLRDIKWLLATRDCHGLYQKFGFTSVNDPDRFMGKNGWKSF